MDTRRGSLENPARASIVNIQGISAGSDRAADRHAGRIQAAHHGLQPGGVGLEDGEVHVAVANMAKPDNLEIRIVGVYYRLYLGKEADGHPIMIGSSEGRSYRHHKINGFGITDYHVPGAGAKTRIIAYGPPPPLAIAASPAPISPESEKPKTTE